MTNVGLLSIYCVIVVFASLAGGWLPTVMRLTHRRLQIVISAVGGLMLGVALFHLLPHAVEHIGSLDDAIGWMMAGLLAMFFLIRSFHSHSHGVEAAPAGQPCDHPSHAHDHAHEHEHSHGHGTTAGSSWIGVAIGLSLHTLIDGAAMAAAVADEQSGEGFALAGIGTFLAVALHKPLDSLSITSLMIAQGWSPKARQAVNLAYSLACPLGAAMFSLGMHQLQGESSVVIGAALAMAAGVFLCISLGDLLPEIEYHSHDRVTLSAALLAGVAVAYAIGFVEPAHLHDHSHGGHSHSGHDHDHPH
jgi:zinc and cadmium transporter